MSQKVVGIIQARMGSNRLPGKSLLDLAGQPLVGRILERVKQTNLLDEIVLAVPNTIDNSVLIKLAKEHYRAKGEGRPTKKDRRDIDDYTE